MDKFIVGLKDQRSQQVLLSNEASSFDKCCETANNMEISKRQQEVIHPGILSTNMVRSGRGRSSLRTGQRQKSVSSA